MPHYSMLRHSRRERRITRNQEKANFQHEGFAVNNMGAAAKAIILVRICICGMDLTDRYP